MANEIIIKDEKILKKLEKYTEIEKCTLEELIIKILEVFIEAQEKPKKEDYLKRYEEDRLRRRQKIENTFSKI